jgi:hypothetical protein
MSTTLWVDDLDLTDEEKILLLRFMSSHSWSKEDIEAEIKLIEDRAFESIILGEEQ